MLLEVRNLEVRYGAVPAVRDLDFHVAKGEIVCFIGANGAGKSTTMLAISGVLRPYRGEIQFGSRSIVGLAPEEIAAMGIGKLGALSRLLLARCGSVLNYASLTRPRVEGQLPIELLRSVLSGSE